MLRSFGVDVRGVGRTGTRVTTASTCGAVATFFSTSDFYRVSTFTGSNRNFTRIITNFKAMRNVPICTFTRGDSVYNNTVDGTRTTGLGGLCNLTLGANTPIMNFCSDINNELGRNARLLTNYNSILGTTTSLSNIMPRVSIILNAYLKAGTLGTTDTSVIVVDGSTRLSLSMANGRSSTTCGTRGNVTSVIYSSTSGTVGTTGRLVLCLPSGGLAVTPRSFRRTPTRSNYNYMIDEAISNGDVMGLFGSCNGRTGIHFTELNNRIMNVIIAGNGRLNYGSTGGMTGFIHFYSTFSLPIMAFMGYPNFRSVGSTAGTSTTCTRTAAIGVSIIANGTVNSNCITLTNANTGTSIICTLPSTIVSPIGIRTTTFVVTPRIVGITASGRTRITRGFTSRGLSTCGTTRGNCISNVIRRTRLHRALVSTLSVLSNGHISALSGGRSAV